ncbi:MAG: hypothetical protein OET79_15405, partial [Nitrospirota bacterium]|nr:hypothetical protein [Nitrospirota bacterium]
MGRTASSIQGSTLMAPIRLKVVPTAGFRAEITTAASPSLNQSRRTTLWGRGSGRWSSAVGWSRPEEESEMISPQAALVYTMVVAAESDREVVDAEIHIIGDLVNHLPIFKTMD